MINTSKSVFESEHLKLGSQKDPSLGLSAPAVKAAPSVSQRVHEIYNQYNPSKISEIPTILEKYKGKEQELISKLEQKYGIASSAMGSNNSSAFGGSFGTGIGNNNNNKPAGVSTFGSFSSFGQPQQQQQHQASSSLFGSSGQVGMGGARFGATSALGNNQQNRSSLFGSR